MVEKVDAELDDIHNASNRTEAISREIHEAGNNADAAMTVLTSAFRGHAGDSFTEFHLKLRYNSNKINSSLEDIADALDQAAKDYDQTDMENAGQISSQGVLENALRGRTGSEETASPVLDDMTEAELATTFENASPEGQTQMIEKHPELFAWHDGIPKADRHEANMIVLEDYVENNPDDSDADSLLKRVNSDDLMLLGFEPAQYTHSGAEGARERTADMSFITATGDPDYADKQVVNMGGTNSDKAWENSVHQVDRAETLRDASLRGEQPEDEIVGIAYVGHEFPNGAQALSQSYAREGAQDFYDFTAGLKETHDGGSEPRQVWDAHSYSAMTAINADQISSNPPADAIILSGGAGTGDAISSASEMNVGAENVYVAQTDEDWITTVMGDAYHGENLAGEDFGAVRIDAGDGEHSSYWDSGSVALDNKQKIINGEDPSTIDYFGLTKEEEREAMRGVRRNW